MEFKRDKSYISLIATFVLGLLVYVCWIRVFKGYSSSSNNLFVSCRECGIIDGIVHWLYWLDTRQLLLMFAFLLPLPMVISNKGRFSSIPFFIGLVLLLIGFTEIDFWHDGNSFESWFGWPSLIRYSFLLMPVWMLWAGSYVLPQAYQLVVSMKNTNRETRFLHKSYMSMLALSVVIICNISFVLVGISTALLLKDAKAGPFCDGFWHSSISFFTAPSSLYFLFAGSSGKIFTVFYAVVVSVLVVIVPYYTKVWKDAFRAWLIAFMCSGFFAFWIIADVFYNYDIFTYNASWDISVLICTVMLYLMIFLSIAFSIYLNIKNMRNVHENRN